MARAASTTSTDSEIIDCSMVRIFAHGSRMGVSVGEKAVLVECHEEIVDELGRPREIDGLPHHLWKQESARYQGFTGVQVASRRTTGIEFPVPKRKYQDIREPQHR